MLTIYNIKMVSKLLSLPTVTIRAWESRYGVIQPIRDESGHRLYSDADIEDLRWLLQQTREKGLSIRHAAQMLAEQKRTAPAASAASLQAGSGARPGLLLAAEAGQPVLVPATSGRPAPALPKAVRPAAVPLGGVRSAAPMPAAAFAKLQQNLYQALIQADLERADRIADQGFAVHPLEDILHQVMVPLLVRIGLEWQHGAISVAQEHLATEFVKQRCLQFFRMFPRNPALPAVTALCPPGERHEVGLILFSLYLRRKGHEVMYLGADTPLEGIPDLLDRKQARWLCISLTDPTLIETTVDALDSLMAARPQTRIILGGEGFSHLEKISPYAGCLPGLTPWDWEVWYQREIARP